MLWGRAHLAAGDCRLCGAGLAALEDAWRGCDQDAVLSLWARLEVPLPALCQILFDAAKLPPLNPVWRILHRQIWQNVADELAALAGA